MAVSKTAYKNYVSLVGTLTEVLTQLNKDNVPASRVINIFYNGTNITIVYSL